MSSISLGGCRIHQTGERGRTCSWLRTRPLRNTANSFSFGSIYAYRAGCPFHTQQRGNRVKGRREVERGNAERLRKWSFDGVLRVKAATRHKSRISARLVNKWDQPTCMFTSAAFSRLYTAVFLYCALYSISRSERILWSRSGPYSPRNTGIEIMSVRQTWQMSAKSI